MVKRFENKVIWVTGASAGIGKAIAIAFAKEGAQLALSARRITELEAVKTDCLAAGAKTVEVVPLDLLQTETFAEKAATIAKQFGRIDMLFNNGGISQRALVKDTSIEVDQRLMAVNYIGTVALTKAVLPYMLEQQSGYIATITSLTGKFGTPYRSSYAASKHALHGFFDSLRAEVWKDNIFVTLLCPGFIKTDISKNALTGDGSALNEMDQAQANGMHPDELARRILNALHSKKREKAFGGKEKYGILIKRLFPNWFAKIVRKTAVR